MKMSGTQSPKTLFEEVRSRLSVCDLGFVIYDSFSHAELVRFLGSHGLVYPGLRMQSLELPELSQHFAEDAWKDPVVFGFLENELDRRYREDIQEMRDMPLEEIRRILSGSRVLWEQKAVGKILWLLLKDGRPEVMRLVPLFTASIEKVVRKIDREEDKKEKFFKRFDKGRLTPGEVEALREVLRNFKTENSGIRKELREKQERIGALKQERDRTREDLASARKDGDRLRDSLRKLEKEIAGKAETIQQMQETVKKIPGSERRGLEHRIHELDRTARKQEHELEEQRRKTSELEGEKKSLEEICRRLKAEAEAAVAAKEAVENELSRCLRAAAPQSPKSFPATAQPTLPQKGKRLGVFVDAGSLRFAAKQMGKRVDFPRLLELITGDRHLVKAIVYTVVFPGQDLSHFFDMLKRSGFEIRSKELVRRSGGPEKGFWDIGLAVDACHFAEKNGLDIVHLATGDGDFSDLLKLLKSRGLHCEVSAFPSQAPEDLVKCADRFFELGEDVFRNDINASRALPASSGSDHRAAFPGEG